VKLLCLGDIHSFVSLQDALFGKGLPPIQCEAVKENSDKSPLYGLQYDWILIRNNESVATRHKELGKAIHQLQFSTCLSVSLQHTDGYTMPMKLSGNEQESVVFEYHANCAPSIKRSIAAKNPLLARQKRNNNGHR